MWDFSTEPEFQRKLDWMLDFVKRECEPLDLLFPGHAVMYNVKHRASRKIIRPLQEQVKAQGLWACHLDPHLGGQGFGQLKLGLMNEIIGRSAWAPTVFGTAAPDTGNAEILAMFGTEEQKRRYLQPLLDGEIVSCFSMTEPQGGADPKQFKCRAYEDGDEWVIEGEKWFSSNARFAEFLIVMAVTDPDAPPHSRMSMLIVPKDTPGIEIIRNVGTMGHAREEDATHAYIRYNKVRVPRDAMLGGPGEGFKVAQARLGGGRVHHAMRTVGRCNRAFEMMVERSVSRSTQGKLLADHQFVQGAIADSAIEIAQFRLLVLHTAWVIDSQPHGAARTGIAMCKVAMAKLLHDVVYRAMHLHGSYGMTAETILSEMWQSLPSLGMADGPTEVHKVQVAKAFTRKAQPSESLFPSYHVPTQLAAVQARYADILEEPLIAEAAE
jgi:acyl-CoA dehydrogenase